MRRSFPKERQIAFLTESCTSMEVWGKAWRMEGVVDSVSMRDGAVMREDAENRGPLPLWGSACWWSWSKQAEGLGLDPSLRGQPDFLPPLGLHFSAREIFENLIFNDSNKA